MAGHPDLVLRAATLTDADCLFQVHVQAVTTLCATSYTSDQIARWFDGRTSEEYIGHITRGRIRLLARRTDDVIRASSRAGRAISTGCSSGRTSPV